MAAPATPVITRTNVIVGQASMFTAPEGTSNAADASSYSSPWVPIGATESGVTMVFNQNTNDINVEEQSTPVDVPVQSTDLSFQTVLSEDTLETIKLAYGSGAITVTAAATGVIGKRTLALSSTKNRLALAFETNNAPQGGTVWFRRVFVPSVLSVANVQTVYRRAADARRYAVTFRAICDPTEVVIVEKTAAALP